MTQAGYKINNPDELKTLKESDIARVGKDIYRRDLAKEQEAMRTWTGGRGTKNSDLAFNRSVYAPVKPIETTDEVVNALPDENQITKSQEIRQNQINNATNDVEKNIAELKQQQEKQTQTDIKTEKDNIKTQQGIIDEQVNKEEPLFQPFQKDYADKYNEQFETEKMIGDYKELAYDLKNLAQGVQEEIANAGQGATLESFANGRRNKVISAYNSKVATTQAAMSALQGSVNMVQTYIDRGINKITNDRNNQISFLNMVKGMAETKQGESKSKLLELTEEEKKQIDDQITELENKNAQLEANRDNIIELMKNKDTAMIVHRAGVELDDTPEEVAKKINDYYVNNPEVQEKNEWKWEKVGKDEAGNDKYGFVNTASQLIKGIDTENGIINGYDISRYATDPKHETAVANIYDGLSNKVNTVEGIDEYLSNNFKGTPIDGKMIMTTANMYNVEPAMIMAIIQQDSSYGTAGKAVRTKNPGNVGNNDRGDLSYYNTWQDGLNAVGDWLSRHRVKIPKEYGRNYDTFLSGYSDKQKEVFNSFNEMDKSNVAQLLNGDVLLKDLMASRGVAGSKARQELLKKAQMVDPAFSNKVNENRYKYTRDWIDLNKPAGKFRTSINTALSHLARAKTLSDELKNDGNFQKANSIAQYISKNINGENAETVVALEQTLTNLASEIANVYKGGNASATETDVEKQEKILNAIAPRNITNALLENTVNLLGGKLLTLEEEYKDTMGKTPTNVIKDRILEELKNSGMDIGHLITSVKQYQDIYPEDNDKINQMRNEGLSDDEILQILK